MSTDFLLREQFVTDPAQVLSEYVSGERLPQQSAATFNHVLYSIAASRPLMSWLRGYAVKHARSRPSLDRFLADFSDAVGRSGGSFVVHALITALTQADKPISVDELTAIKDGAIHVFGPGPDRPGGGVLTGAIFDGDDETFNTFKTDGTWTGTGTSSTWTTMDTETGTIFTAGGTVGTENTVTDLETWHTGTDTTGTDSTGTDTTGTDSTGTDTTGTDFTGTDTTGTDETGTDDDSQWRDFGETNYAIISLVALNRYATQIVRAGALAAAGGR